MAERCVLVIADERDEPARRFVESYRTDGTRLVTPADLCTPGWRLPLGKVRESVAVSGGERIPESAIAGVVTRLRTVDPASLSDIAVEDRSYVSAETSAFLLAWLNQLTCLVINAPVAPFLSGPCWPWERWVQVAHQNGIAVGPVRREIRLGPTPSRHFHGASAPITVTVIGSREIGEADAALRSQARSLARSARMELLAVQFDGAASGARLIGIDAWPALDDPDLGSLIMARMH